MQFASRLDNVETSAIRELFKLLGKPGIISFAGGFPDSAMFDVEGLKEASQKALTEEPGGALQYGATEGYEPLRTQLSAFMKTKGVDVDPSGLIVTTGSQQALDLLGKTMISPGDKVIVEGPTFLATIQCFRLYGAQLISAPIDANGVKTDELEKLIAEHKPKFVYLIPTFGNPSGTMLSLERRKKVLELALRDAERQSADAVDLVVAGEELRIQRRRVGQIEGVVREQAAALGVGHERAAAVDDSVPFLWPYAPASWIVAPAPLELRAELAVWIVFTGDDGGCHW